MKVHIFSLKRDLSDMAKKERPALRNMDGTITRIKTIF